MKSIVHSEDELHRAAQELLSAFPAARVFCFYGEMGAGKTTFIKVLCQALGVDDVTSSPTFAIVNEYLTETGESIYHFDFYRIDNLTEAYEIGVEDYLYSGSYCFIEWTEKIEPLVQPEFVKVSLSVQENGDRWIIAE